RTPAPGAPTRRASWGAPGSAIPRTASSDGHRVDRRARRTVDLERGGDVEEVPAAVRGACSREALQGADLRERDAKVAHGCVVEGEGAAGVRVRRDLVRDRVRHEVGDLHLVEPLHQLRAVLQARLAEVLVELVALLEEQLQVVRADEE